MTTVFLTEDTPSAIASSLDDPRLFKQAVECFQMLAASLWKQHGFMIHRLTDDGSTTPMAHGNIGSHPATVWVEHSRESFRFTYNLGIECIKEHSRRYSTPPSHKLIFQAKQVRQHIDAVPFPSEAIQWWPLVLPEEDNPKWSPTFEWRLAKKVAQLHYSLKHPTLFTNARPPAWLVEMNPEDWS